MDDLKLALLTALGNIISHAIIRAFEKREALRRDSPKHMRKG